MEKVKVEVTTQGEAARAMTEAGLNDPERNYTPETIAASGNAFRLTTPAGEVVIVVEKRGPELWIHGAAASGSTGLTHDTLATIEAMAKNADCNHVAFQTERPGLVRLAKKKGYRVIGLILEKRL